MTSQQFDNLVETTLSKIKDLLIVKGKEYRRNGNVFHNFEEGARSEARSREQVLKGFKLKHEISIKDLINDLDAGKLPSLAAVEEKFTDDLIYTMLLKAMFVDRIEDAEQMKGRMDREDTKHEPLVFPKLKTEDFRGVFINLKPYSFAVREMALEAMLLKASRGLITENVAEALYAEILEGGSFYSTSDPTIMPERGYREIFLKDLGL